MRYDRRGEHPAMEGQLHEEFRELRRTGIKVKGWWFKTRAKQILELNDPASTFKYSEGWFTNFKRRYKISLRRPTNTAQKQPSDKEDAIVEFTDKFVQFSFLVREMAHRRTHSASIRLQMCASFLLHSRSNI